MDILALTFLDDIISNDLDGNGVDLGVTGGRKVHGFVDIHCKCARTKVTGSLHKVADIRIDGVARE